jgi:type I restriction enzyme R subunit
VNDGTVNVLGSERLRGIERDVADTARSNVSIDWTQREQAKANLRRMVRRVLNRHGYPPDQREAATQLVIEQAEEFARAETAAGPLYRG